MSENLATQARPQSWAEVIGQNAVTSILQKQIADGRFRQAYLFVGSAGSGKTTCAYLFANDINNGKGFVREIDAARNNGIDTIRELEADAQQTSPDSDYKVYIIDEAHQLTRQAWDASLKLIEKPPAHTVFIFCTTNPQKIPETILSRVQRFDFKRVPKDEITDRLEFICNEYLHIKFERSGLERIAFNSNGCVRDAVNKLDLCSGAVEDKLTAEIVDRVLGYVPEESLLLMTDALLTGRYEDYEKALNDLKSITPDLSNIYISFTSFVLGYSIFCETGDINYTSLTENIKSRLDRNNKAKLKTLLDRLIRYDRYQRESGAEVYLKVVGLEMMGV